MFGKLANCFLILYNCFTKLPETLAFNLYDDRKQQIWQAKSNKFPIDLNYLIKPSRRISSEMNYNLLIFWDAMAQRRVLLCASLNETKEGRDSSSFFSNSWGILSVKFWSQRKCRGWDYFKKLETIERRWIEQYTVKKMENTSNPAKSDWELLELCSKLLDVVILFNPNINRIARFCSRSRLLNCFSFKLRYHELA